MQRLVREPLLHFLLLGGLLLFARDMWLDDITALVMPEHIVVTQADRQHLRSQWMRQTGRLPNDAELAVLVRSYVDEELLFREAKRLQLHKHDPVTRQRLVRNMRFAERNQESSDQALLEAATALGMVNSDPIVRRRLVQLMRYRLESRVEITEAELQDYYHRRRDQYRRPARVHFEHRFFSPDRRGDQQAEEEAAKALTALRAGQPVDYADPFPLGNRFASTSLGKVEQQFGPGFADALHRAGRDQWIGPLRSAYGLHLVQVHEIEPAGIADYASVRPAAAASLFADLEQETVQAALRQLRSRYHILIQEGSS